MLGHLQYQPAKACSLRVVDRRQKTQISGTILDTPGYTRVRPLHKATIDYAVSIGEENDCVNKCRIILGHHFSKILPYFTFGGRLPNLRLDILVEVVTICYKLFLNPTENYL